MACVAGRLRLLLNVLTTEWMLVVLPDILWPQRGQLIFFMLEPALDNVTYLHIECFRLPLQ